MLKSEEVIALVRDQIDAGQLAVGARIPSVREMSRTTGFSSATVHEAYLRLGGQGLVEARPRSGCYVKRKTRRLTDFTLSTKPPGRSPGGEVTTDALVARAIASWQDEGMDCFGSPFPSVDLVPRPELLASLRQVIRSKDQAKVNSLECAVSLRAFVAQRASLRGIEAAGSDIVIVPSGRAALTFALDAATQPGDTVLVESPSFYSVFPLLKQRGLRVVEIYSHPVGGVDAVQFEHLVSRNRVKACLLMPVGHYPTGISYSQQTLRAIASIAREHGTTIIENDEYGELSYTSRSPPTLKSFDNDYDESIQFGSFSSVFGPDFGLGWVISRRYGELVGAQRLLASAGSNDLLLQLAIRHYLSRASYDHGVRRLGRRLQVRVQQGLDLINDIFPSTCAVSVPTAGFTCWVRGPKSWDAFKAARVAVQQGVSIAPGPLFSVSNSFTNFFSLNLSFEWTPNAIEKLRLVGSLLEPRRGS